jgi:hypothetical protein
VSEPFEDSEGEFFIGTEELKNIRLRSRLMGIKDAENAYSPEAFEELEKRLAIAMTEENPLLGLNSRQRVEFEAKVTQQAATIDQLRETLRDFPDHLVSSEHWILEKWRIQRDAALANLK